jgi:HPt (histidine-containing phosphotransfer) domain-containing protein
MQITSFENINLDYLKLMTGNDEEMTQTMLFMLLDEIPSEMQLMKEKSLEAGGPNMAEIKEISHKMKSTLAFVGNPKLTEANLEIENIARGNGNPSDLPAFFKKIDENLPAVLKDLEAAAGN